MIGVVTPYKVDNYGTKLQAYAMQKLFSKYDDAEIIDFLTKSDTRTSAVIGKLFSFDIWHHKASEKMKVFRLKQNKKLFEDLQIRKRAINSFDEDFLRFSEHIVGSKNLNELVKKYDCIVCGSDQLWAPRNVIADYFTLTWVQKKCKVISFSASFGIARVPTHLKAKYKKFLERFDAIAVREKNGVSIVNELTGKDAVVTADPTLMLDKCEWETVSSTSQLNIGDPYIFCYFLGENEEHRNFAKQLKEATGYKIVILPHFIKYCKADEAIGDYKLYDVTPSDFLHLIYNAKIVLTDSFHATVFSFIFKKKIGVFERFESNATGSTNSRIYSLLENVEAQNCLVKNNMSVGEFLSIDMNYNVIGEHLLELRNCSGQYIIDALTQNKRLGEER